ncbi:MAG: DUF389 domain-containing protein [Bacteroidaceae bacterium]|nr:DUF389 domain-containing protein [Bacteroidaceae bacterium]
MEIEKISERIKIFFNILPDKENEQEIIAQISSGVSFRGANLWVLIFAIFIASLGLNVNSTAVIIGAMLISPLMGPIIGMGLAVGINDLDLLKRSAKNYGVATLISVLTATVYFLISPLSEAQSELLARTSPTLYDVLIAFCGGAAGIIALCTRGKGNVIPGVAIATALMPPLCTAGFGLATGHWLYFLGAFYLFFINTVFIALATFCGVRLLQFSQHEFVSSARAVKARRIMMVLVVVTMLPAAYMTIRIVQQSVFNNNVNRFVKAELQQLGTQIISSSVDKDSLKLRIVAVGREISEAHQQEAQKRMEFYGLNGFELRVIQGAQSDSLMLLNNELTAMNTSRKTERQQLINLTAQVNSLNSQLEEYTRYEALSKDVENELETLFPEVNSLSLARVSHTSKDTTAVTHYVAAIIGTAHAKPLPKEDVRKLHEWLQVRIKADSLIVVNSVQ